jgi:hypothetical protein
LDDRDHPSVLPHGKEVMGEENRIEDLGQEGYRLLGNMLQDPVRYTVWARSLAELETPDGFLNLVRVGKPVFAGRGQEVRSHRHVNNFNNCRYRRIGHLLKLSLQCVGKCFGFLTV